MTERPPSDEFIQSWEARILESISSSQPLPQILDRIALSVQDLIPGALASILLADAKGSHLRHGAAPGLPDAYNRAIDGISIGPASGVCGTAAHRRQRIVVTDIESDDLVAEYRNLARAHHLRSCWSTPVLNATGDVLATFAIYHLQPSTPQARDLALIDRLAHVVGIAVERDRQDTALRQQATLLDHAQDAILVRDLDHHILYWNRSAERLYGWAAAEAIGRSIQQLLYRDTTAFLAATRETFDKGEWVGEIEQYTRQGELLVVEGHWTLVRDERGQPRSILAINTDITQRKKLEAQFLRAQRLESIGTLAGGIAHDLNNVLAPIMMSVDLLRMTERDREKLDMLAIISRSVQRASEMVNQVLSFARGMEGRRVEVRLEHVVSDLLKIARDTFPKSIRFEEHLDPALWLLQADPTQLHQVLLNLCVNARDAMPDGGRITLTASNSLIDEHYAAMNIEARVGPYVKIEVQDTGTGIPKDIVDKIFDPFFTTKEVGRGTGLGLSTSLAIVKSHGGFIRVYSDPGVGTCFRIHLPAQAGSRAGATDHAQASLPRGRGETVLVIDDETYIRQVCKQTLEAFGYKVLLAAHGVEALTIYSSRGTEIAAVLTDMMMPVMDGPATILALRRLNPQLRIIGASGIAANGKVAQAAGAGVRHFLPKPYTAETLLRALRQALDDPEG